MTLQSIIAYTSIFASGFAVGYLVARWKFERDRTKRIMERLRQFGGEV